MALPLNVSHPRRIVPAETYLVTRRCSQRTFRLRPGADTNQIFLYCLAFAAEKTGVLVHAACVMSNHHHLVVTDPRGVLPDFLRELHRLTAKVLNASQGQWENLWAAEPCNVVRLVTDEDVEEKVAYVVSNPVAAGLVRLPDDWPGVVLWGERTLRIARPKSYFRKDGICAPELELSVAPPPVRSGAKRSTNDCVRRLTRAIAAKVAKAQRAVVASGRAFLGNGEAVTASVTQRARSREERFGVVPTSAARARAVRDHLCQVERHFRRSYRAALHEWRKGRRNVVFPFGTWGLVVFHSAAAQNSPALERGLARGREARSHDNPRSPEFPRRELPADSA